MISTVRDLQPGDLLIGTVSGKQRFDSRVVALEDVQPGHQVTGPRGGRYALTQAGAQELVVVVLGNGRRPLLKKISQVTMHRS